MTDRTEEILAANKALRADLKEHAKTVTDLTARLETSETKGKHTRWGLYGVAGVLAAALAVTGWVKLDNVNDRVDDNSDAIITVQDYNAGLCEASNKTRADALKLWTRQNDLIDLLIPPGTPGVPKKVQDTIAGQRKLADKTYAQKDCTKVSNGAKPTPEGDQK